MSVPIHNELCLASVLRAAKCRMIPEQSDSLLRSQEIGSLKTASFVDMEHWPLLRVLLESLPSFLPFTHRRETGKLSVSDVQSG